MLQEEVEIFQNIHNKFISGKTAFFVPINTGSELVSYVTSYYIQKE